MSNQVQIADHLVWRRPHQPVQGESANPFMLNTTVSKAVAAITFYLMAKHGFTIGDIVSCLVEDPTVIIGKVTGLYYTSAEVRDYKDEKHSVPYSCMRLASKSEIGDAKNKASKIPVYKYIFTGGGDVELRFVTPTVHDWVESYVSIPKGETAIEEALPDECEEAVKMVFGDSYDEKENMRCLVTIGSGNNDRALAAHCAFNGKSASDFFEYNESAEFAKEHNLSIVDEVQWVIY